MKLLIGPISLFFVLSILSVTACGDFPAEGHANEGPRTYIVDGSTIIVPDSAGRAQLIIPEGEVVLGFFSSTAEHGKYSFSFTGTSLDVLDGFVPTVGFHTRGIWNQVGGLDEDELEAAFLPAISTAVVVSDAPVKRTFTAPAGRNKSGFVDVDAVKVAEGNRVILYADDPNPMVRDVAQSLVDYVEHIALPQTTKLFGPIPDVDGSGKLILLMSDVVNNFSNDPGAFTGGFFSSKDLTGREGSNHASMLYLYLPKPRKAGGAYDHVDDYQALLKEVIVHELQHIISFGARQLVGARSEESWLNEGISHWAEEYFGFHRSNRIRSRHFLQEPTVTPLIGRGTALSERGASYLFVKFLVEQHEDDPTFIRRLVQSGKRGIANIEAVTGRPFEEVVADWTASLYRDHAEQLLVEDLGTGLQYNAELSQSAKTFIRLRGPAVVDLTVSPEGNFRGVMLESENQELADSRS